MHARLLLLVFGILVSLGCTERSAPDGGATDGGMSDGAMRADVGDAGATADAEVDGAIEEVDDAGRAPDAGETPGAVRYGFNAKGSLNTIEQTTYVAAMLSGLTPALRQQLHIRVSGGTLSQKETFGSPWTDAMMDAWIQVQEDSGVGFVYVVNGNDSPANQLAFIQRWIARGAHFSFVEMMNEYYLPKFANYDAMTMHPDEATRQVTPVDYVEEILPAYLAVLGPLDLPFFVICAPAGNPRLDAWNEVVVGALEAHPGWNAGVTLHLYDDGSGSFDYDQITRLRDSLPSGTRIAVTEAGLIDESITDYEEAGRRTVAHYDEIASRLEPGDYLFDQILYSNYAADTTATLHPSAGGITAKGRAVLDWLATAP